MSFVVDRTRFNNDPFLGDDFVAVTPSDTIPVYVNSRFPRKIHVGGAGRLVLFDGSGNAVDFGNVPSGWNLMLNFTGVAATTTTATYIVAIG
jgi:hypothetical protein